MIRFLLCLASVVNVITAWSQNIDREDVKLNYIFLPLQKFPDTTETYHVSLKPAKTVYGNSFLSLPEAEKIRLNGYYRLPSATDADILVEADLASELFYKGVTMHESEHTYKKDKNSPEIKYTAYTYAVKYTLPAIHYSIKTGSGKLINEGVLGGKDDFTWFGNTGYKNHYSSEYQLKAAWNDAKMYKLAEWESENYVASFNNVPGICASWCLVPAFNSFNVRYVKEKKTNLYDDLRQAKELLQEGVSYIRTDRVELINKFIQPDYEKRVETINKAIVIWEKALEESDLKNKKARIDQKVTRHIYYNLSLAYALVNNYEKAQQYLQGREDEETDKVLLKNVFAGMGSLSSFIDVTKKGYEANNWRKLLTAPEETYVYKDPVTRQREKDEAMAAQLAKQKAITDSIKLASKTKTSPSKPKAKTAAKKGVPVNKKTAGVASAMKQ